MDFLSKFVSIYGYNYGDFISKYEHYEVEFDDCSHHAYVETQGNYLLVKPIDERPAKWFSVAVYTRAYAYGGPEEGGWHYPCGELIEHSRIKFFDNYEEAYKYAEFLWDWCEYQKENYISDVDYIVRCTTEKMPDTYYPKKRPYYC